MKRPSKKQSRKRSSKRLPRKVRSTRVIPRTLAEFHAMPARAKEYWERTLEGARMMQEHGWSASKAARYVRLPYGTFRKLAGDALTRRSNGRLAAKPAHRLLRPMKILAEDGIQEIAVVSSREASKLGKYWDAVSRFVAEGDARKLRQFRRKYVLGTKGNRHPLLTDLETLDELANAGVLSFESLYGRSK